MIETTPQVLEAFAKAEKKLKPNWKEMFTEVLCDTIFTNICVCTPGVRRDARGLEEANG